MFQLLGVFKAIIYGIVFYRTFQQTPMELPLILLSAALVISGFWRNLYNYSCPRVNMVTLCLDLLLVFLFSLVTGSGSFDKLIFVYLIEGVAVLPPKGRIIYSLVTLADYIGASLLYDFQHIGYFEPPGLAEMLLYALIILLVWGERRQREQRLDYKRMAEELRYTNLQLVDSLKWSDQLAAETERQRISGEIHDSLGHDLTGLILTLEAGKRIMQTDLEAAGGYWDKALEMARSAMQSVRELVAGKELDLQFELGSYLMNMSKQVRNASGLQVELEIPARITGLSVQEQFNLYRIFQEAITNTMKHARAQNARIVIKIEPDEIIFSYADDGIGTAGIQYGTGLKGMMARMSVMGGTIHFASTSEKGFFIEGRLDTRGLRA
ncbi:MAG: sensor histidine kinase [Firmicutes bacterium]|nr:sensor histidine kinase [Bacillota bacterium]